MAVKFEIGRVYPPLFPDSVEGNRLKIPASGADVTLLFKVKNVGTVPFAPYFQIEVKNKHTLVDEEGQFEQLIPVGQTGEIDHTFWDPGGDINGNDRDVYLRLYEKAGRHDQIGETAKWEDAYFSVEMEIVFEIVSLTLS